MAEKDTSHLANQWQEESKDMLISEKDAKKTRAELRAMSPDEVNWDVAIPKIYAKSLNIKVLDIVLGKIDDIAEVIEEHDIVVDGVRDYHRKHGYDAAFNLEKFYEKYKETHEEADPNFDFKKLVKDYEGSTKK